MPTLTCRTPGCWNYNLPAEIEDNGTRVVCAGGCGKTLREQDSEHPNFPTMPPGPSLEDLIAAEVARQLGAQS